MELKEKIYINSPMYMVWKELTDGEWWKNSFNIDGDFIKGGEIKYSDNSYSGHILDMIKGKELSFTWKKSQWNKGIEIKFNLYPEPAGTILILSSKYAEGFQIEEKEQLTEINNKWKEIIKSLKKTMENRFLA